MKYFSKLLATALGTVSLFNAMSGVSLAASIDFDVHPNYNNDLCIRLGTISQRGTFRVVWGSYEGTVSITGDGGQKNYALALFARGNNYPTMTLYYDDGLKYRPGLEQSSCSNKGLEVYWLDWRQR